MKKSKKKKMGGILSNLIGVSVDYLIGSLTACIWEWVFNPYDASKSTLFSVLEGLLQLTASVSTAYWLSGILTPVGATSNLGMVAIFYFTLMYSPNLRAKLNAGHQTTKQTLMFTSPSLLFASSPKSSSSSE